MARLIAGFFMVMIAALLFMDAPVAMAQSGTGQIKGMVVDPTGAVVPGAAVTVISLDNGFTRSTVSGADGSFLIPLLDPQHYRLQIVAPNFKKLERGPITVQVTETADVGHISLTVGAQSETVTVTGQEELLNTENATLGKVFDSTLIEALPLSTRNFTQLLSLQAGVVGSIPSTLQFGNGTSQFSVGGGRVYDNAVNLDGVNAVSSSSSGAFSIPSPDALDEFKMQTSTYSAEYGRAGSGSIDVTTKSGTNQFHGDGFYFFRNKALDANSYFNKLGQLQSGVPNVPADIRQNQWGGTVGGPIIRNKLFFFFSFQSTNQINGNAGTINNYTYMLIPAGDRSNAGNLRQQLGAIYGGYAGLFGGTAVAKDGSNINPVAIGLLQAKFPDGTYILPSFPQSDILNTGLPYYSHAYFSLLPKYKEKQYLGNIDYKISPRQTLSSRYFNSHTLFDSLSGSIPGFTATQPGVSENFVLTHNFTINPTMVNEAKAGYLRQFGGSVYVNPSTLSASGTGMTPVVDGQNVFPQLVLAANGIVIQGRGFSLSTENQYTVSDTVSKLLGRHNMRFGGLIMNHRLTLDSAGTWGSGAIIMVEPADFLLGMNGAQNGSGLSNLLLTAGNSGSFRKDFLFTDYGYFFQDDFKIRPNLTVNLGIRWDYFPWPTEQKGREDNFVRSLIGEGDYGIPTVGQQYTGYTIAANFQAHNPNFVIPAGVTTVSDKDGFTANWKNYAPRFGFAWAPEKGLSIRGGYGLFFSRVSTVLAQSLILGPPFNNSDLYSFGTDGTFQDPFTHLGLPTDNQYPLWTPRQYSPTVTPSLLFNAVSENLRNPYTQQFNLSVQQELGKNLLLEIAYQGQTGIKLLQALSQNQAAVASPSHPIRGLTNNLPASVSGSTAATGGSLNIQGRSPVAGMLSDEGLAISQTTASSHFNALEATLNQRFSHGLQFVSAFTWSKNMDSNTIGYGASGSSAVPPNDNTTTHHMGLSSVDRTFRFTTSAVYEIPDPIRNPHNFAQGTLNHVLGGWGMATSITAQTGNPIAFIVGATGPGFSAIKLQGTLTASLKPGYSLSDVVGHGPAKNRLNHYFNTNRLGDGATEPYCSAVAGQPSVFACPDAIGFGNTPTNTQLRNPGQKTVDFSLTKKIKVHENYQLEVRGDFFNLFNWVNFAGPDSGVLDATFGVINGTTVDPRVVQVAAKFKF